MSDDKDPKEILLDIHERVQAVERKVERTPRDVPEEGTKRREVLKYVHNNPGTTSKQIENELNYDPTSALRSLWSSFILDRTQKQPHNYRTSDLGERVVESYNNGESNGSQVTLNKNRPWEDTKLKGGGYIILHLIDEYDGKPTTNDLKKEFAEFRIGNERSCSPRFSDLYNKDFVIRTPWRPYKYALSEKGEKFMEKHGVDNIKDYKE